MSKTYKIGFTRPALLKETVIVAQLFSENHDWQDTQARIAKDNLLQTRTNRSSDILFGEIHKRLNLLNERQIELMAEDFAQDARHLVWIALCKQYSFIGDFTLEVMVQAHLRGKLEVTYDDYGYFFSTKADWHPELERVSNKTRSNARQALFQMMRQCELITNTNQLISQILSSAIQNCSSETDLSYIPGAIRL
jgi:hypothetical protein